MMSNWRWNRLAPLVLALSAAAWVLLGGTAGTAAAGANGQQINYFSRQAYAQCTTGKNQSGETVQGCSQLQTGNNFVQDYWWVGPVSITWYHSDNRYVTSTCNVPLSQSGDSFSCYEPS